ncbi:MAG: 50S ribosomal protein L31 [Magnetococcales bacterium]|nr:50S ribosomal protein L31 [Magnetococcales bacterium]MBF0151149.1 50S ribosomal protein L31 [Magnetococcales bacterium]MBF0172537.1 50S ribosomal protein L31 [Magnetococcales bacterium]MBF0347063.1 50S ribosomal protein L31 [Magnetococcales bacterium]MBF0629990.1 50S ribosomal protein L31 [Magnetococcales bacterium]
MKKDIHPEYNEITFTCSGCGHSLVTRSTGKNTALGVCSNCHPFYTGKHKLLDTAGRVERFMRKYGKTGKAMTGE